MSDNALDAVNGSEDTGISSSFDLFQSRPTSGNSDVVVEIPSGSATPRPNTRHSVFITEATVITSDATQPEIEDHLLASRDSSHRPNLIKRLQSFRPQDDFYKRIGEIQSETSSRPVSPDQKAFDNPVDVLFGFIEQTSEALLECLARESKDAQSSLDLLLDGTNRPVDFSSRVNALTTTFDGAFRAIKKLILVNYSNSG